MGYTTTFSGHIDLSRKLTMAEAKQILEFNDDPDCIPAPNPGGYMQWVPSESLDAIGWDGNEKFYDYVEWLTWLCAWLKERGIETGGELLWSGEDTDDTGIIYVVGGVVTTSASKKHKKNFRPMTLRDLADLALEKAVAATRSQP